MEQFLLNLLKTSLLGALVIAALLAAKPLWKERYRAGTRCFGGSFSQFSGSPQKKMLA